MYYTLENFIDYHSNYEIANEGFSFSEFKAKIVKIFINIIRWIESKVRKMKDSKIKSTLMKLLKRAKEGLSKSKSLNKHDKDLAQELANEAKDIREECEKVVPKEYSNQSKKSSGIRTIDLGEDFNAKYDNPAI